MWIKTFLFQVGPVVEEEVEGVVREVHGEKQGREDEVQAREEILLEEVTIREQITTAIVINNLSWRTFQDAKTCTL